MPPFYFAFRPFTIFTIISINAAIRKSTAAPRRENWSHVNVCICFSKGTCAIFPSSKVNRVVRSMLACPSSSMGTVTRQILSESAVTSPAEVYVCPGSSRVKSSAESSTQLATVSRRSAGNSSARTVFTILSPSACAAMEK